MPSRSNSLSQPHELPLDQQAPHHRVTVRCEELLRLLVGQVEPSVSDALDRETGDPLVLHEPEERSPTPGLKARWHRAVRDAVETEGRDVSSERERLITPSSLSPVRSTTPSSWRMSRQTDTSCAISLRLDVVLGSQSIDELGARPRDIEVRPHGARSAGQLVHVFVARRSSQARRHRRAD